MVVVSSTLVERLDHEEVAAILAHELAHIEHFNPRRLRRLSFVSFALVAAAALLSPVVRVTLPEALTTMLILWPVVLMASHVAAGAASAETRNRERPARPCAPPATPRR